MNWQQYSLSGVVRGVICDWIHYRSQFICKFFVQLTTNDPVARVVLHWVKYNKFWLKTSQDIIMSNVFSLKICFLSAKLSLFSRNKALCSNTDFVWICLERPRDCYIHSIWQLYCTQSIVYCCCIVYFCT